MIEIVNTEPSNWVGETKQQFSDLPEQVRLSYCRLLWCTAIFLSELVTILSMQFFVKLCDEGFFPLPDSKLDGKDCSCLVSHIVPEPSKTP